MNEAEQKALLEYAGKYPLCTRWNNHFKEAMAIINFLGWLTNGEPSEFVDEGHDFCIAGYGRYKTGEIPEDADSVDKMGIILEQCIEGQEQLIPITTRNEDLAYAYLGIDKVEIEKERRAMLDDIRKMNA